MTSACKHVVAGLFVGLDSRPRCDYPLHRLHPLTLSTMLDFSHDLV
jgi:hypothetical protein